MSRKLKLSRPHSLGHGLFWKISCFWTVVWWMFILNSKLLLKFHHIMNFDMLWNYIFPVTSPEAHFLFISNPFETDAIIFWAVRVVQFDSDLLDIAPNKKHWGQANLTVDDLLLCIRFNRVPVVLWQPDPFTSCVVLFIHRFCLDDLFLLNPDIYLFWFRASDTALWSASCLHRLSPHTVMAQTVWLDLVYW